MPTHTTKSIQWYRVYEREAELLRSYETQDVRIFEDGPSIYVRDSGIHIDDFPRVPLNVSTQLIDLSNSQWVDPNTLSGFLERNFLRVLSLMRECNPGIGPGMLSGFAILDDKLTLISIALYGFAVASLSIDGVERLDEDLN